MANGAHHSEHTPRGENSHGRDLASVKTPNVDRGGEALRESQIQGRGHSSVLPSMTAAIGELKYPEILAELLKVGPQLPIVCVKISDETSPIVTQAIQEYAKLYSLEIYLRPPDQRDEKITTFYIYDRQSTQELIPKLKKLADAGELFCQAEEFSRLPTGAHDFVKAVTAPRTRYYHLISDIVEGRLPGSLNVPRAVETNPDALDSVKRSVFEAIKQASVEGRTRSLSALKEDFADLIAGASVRNLVELYQGILRSEHSLYERALHAISNLRMVLGGTFEPKEGSVYAKDGSSYMVVMTLSNTFETVLKLRADVRVGLDLDEQLELVRQGLRQWKIANLDGQFANVQKGPRSTQLCLGSKLVAKHIVEAQRKSGFPQTLEDLVDAQIREGMEKHGQLVFNLISRVSEQLQPSKRREIGELFFANWQDADEYLSFITTQQWAIARLLGTKPQDLGLDEESVRTFWAGSKIASNEDILAKYRGTLHARVKPEILISEMEWQEASKYAELTIVQMKERIYAQDTRASNIDAVLKPRGASLCGYLGAAQELQYQLIADYLTFNKAGLDCNAGGALLQNGLESIEFGNRNFLDKWQAIGNGIEMMEPNLRARQSHISPFYGPVWKAFGEKSAPEFLVRNIKLPGFVLEINAEGISLMKDFGFLQGEEYKPEIKSWRGLPYRVNAADAASILKGEIVPEVSYSQVVEFSKQRSA